MTMWVDKRGRYHIETSPRFAKQSRLTFIQHFINFCRDHVSISNTQVSSLGKRKRS